MRCGLLILRSIRNCRLLWSNLSVLKGRGYFEVGKKLLAQGRGAYFGCSTVNDIVLIPKISKSLKIMTG